MSKVLLCCIGKNENRYIREYVEHYKNLGFDNIMLYDNNDIDGEHFEDVIGDYINEGFVILKDYRGRKVCQLSAYDECYHENYKNYGWIAFFDCDEFLTLVKKTDIHDYLGQNKFKNVDCIYVNWMGFTDNDQLTFTEGRLLERFAQPHPFDLTKAYDFPENNHIKSIVSTKNHLSFKSGSMWLLPHSPYGGTIYVNNIGCKVKQNHFQNYNFQEAYLKHFSTKSITEFCEKLLRGFPDHILMPNRYIPLLHDFFMVNKFTEEKKTIISNILGIDYKYKKKSVQIFMLCYEPKDYGFIDNTIITPLQCGASVSGFDVCELKDNVGENSISSMNKFYMENSGTFWYGSNVIAKYIGQMQYGRRLDISEDWDFDEIFKKYDVIVPKPYHYVKKNNPEDVTIGGDGWIPSDTVQGGYAYSHCGRDIDLLELIVKQLFPDYSSSWDKYIKNGTELIYSSGFVMPMALFKKYYHFLFSCLMGWLKVNQITKPSDLYIHVMKNLYTGGYIREDLKDPLSVPTAAIDWQTSIGGFLGERLLTLFVFHNTKNILYVDYIKTEDKPL